MFADTDNVLGFEISMYNSLAMKILDSLNDLRCVFRSLLLSKGSLAQDFLIEVMIAILHHQVDFIPADMKPVGRKDVRVLTVEMNLHFIDEVLQFDFLLAEGLDSDEHGVDVGNSEDDVASLALAHFANHLQLVFRSFESLGFCHFLQCLVHIFQFDCHWGFLLEKFILQTTRRVVGLQLFLHLVDVPRRVGVGVANLIQFSGVFIELGCRGG